MAGNLAPIIRRAGNIDRFLVTQTALGLYTSILSVVQYSATTSRKLSDKTFLYPALHRVIQQEAALRVVLVGGNTNNVKEHPFFVPCVVTDEVLDRICVFRDDVIWNESAGDTNFFRFCEDQLSIGWDTDDSSIPLWRLIVCRDNTVLFFYHHGIADGRSGPAFHARLTEALNFGPDPKEGDSLDKIAPAQLWPSLEECVDTTYSWMFLLVLIWQSIIPTTWTKLYKTWTALPIPMSPVTLNSKDTSLRNLGFELKVHIDYMELTPEQSAKLLQVCRKHETTITSTLYTLAAYVISRVVSQDINAPSSSRTYTSLCATAPVSLRHLSGVPQIAVCNHPSSYEETIPLQETFKWEDAKRRAAAFKEWVQKNGLASQRVGTLSLLGNNYASYFKWKLGHQRPWTFELSNLGRFPASAAASDGREGEWRAGRAFWTQGEIICGPALSLTVVGNGLDGLSICISWSHQAMEEQCARKIVAGIKDYLLNLIDSGN